MSQRVLLRIACAVFFFVALPVVAFGNGGTPLMAASVFWILIFNNIIGVVEGGILGYFFGFRMRWTIPTMILVNYVSALIGFGFLSAVSDHIAPTIYNAKLIIWVMVGFAYLLTLVIEWPFILFCFRKQQRPLVRSLKATFIVQTVSYIMMVPYLWSFSTGSMLKKTDVDPSLDYIQNTSAILYYIASEDGDIYRQCLGEKDAVKVFEAGSVDPKDHLMVRSTDEGRTWSLFLHQDYYGDARNTLIPEPVRMPSYTQKEGWRKMDDPRDHEDMSWSAYGKALDVRQPDARQWSVKTGYWSHEGLSFWHSEKRESIYLAMETPFVTWRASNATVLPGDEVVFQLGDQICIYERESNKLGLLAR